MTETTDISYSIVIDAAIDSVFDLLTTEAGLLAWVGVEASADPIPGGVLTWTHENGATMVGRFIELDRPRRVLFSYGWKDDLMGVAPESTTVEIILTPKEGQTHLELTHRDLPIETAADHRQGWAHFLPQLELAHS